MSQFTNITKQFFWRKNRTGHSGRGGKYVSHNDNNLPRETLHSNRLQEKIEVKHSLSSKRWFDVQSLSRASVKLQKKWHYKKTMKWFWRIRFYPLFLSLHWGCIQLQEKAIPTLAPPWPKNQCYGVCLCCGFSQCGGVNLWYGMGPNGQKLELGAWRSSDTPVVVMSRGAEDWERKFNWS